MNKDLKEIIVTYENKTFSILDRCETEQLPDDKGQIGDLSNETLKKIEEFLQNDLDEELKNTLYYPTYCHKRAIILIHKFLHYQKNKKISDELYAEINFLFIDAIRYLDDLPKLEKSKNSSYIYTAYHDLFIDYAGFLDVLGRHSWALDYYMKAYSINPNSREILSNLGICLADLAPLVTYKEDICALLKESLKFLERALEQEESNIVINYINRNNKLLELYSCNLNIKSLEIEEFQKLSSYEQWCLNNRLWINFQNDVFSIDKNRLFDRDYFPEVFQRSRKSQDLLSQIIGKFKYNRKKFFEYLNRKKDPSINMNESLYELESIYNESYGIMDKIAYFLNDYFKIHHRDKSIGIRKEPFLKKLFSPFLESESFYENKGIRGIYYTIKAIKENDLHEGTFNAPSMKKLDEIKGGSYHKSFRVSEFIDNDMLNEESDIQQLNISINEFEHLTLILLKLIREMILNLAISIKLDYINKEN